MKVVFANVWYKQHKEPALPYRQPLNYKTKTSYITMCLLTLVAEIKNSAKKDKGNKQIWLAGKLKKKKSYNMVNGFMQNRQQPRLEVLSEIANVLNIDIRELITSTKKEKE